MVEAVQGGQFGAYADFDNRNLSRHPQRAALVSLPVIDISPFLSSSSRDDRMRTARELRSACVDIRFFFLTGHGFTQNKLDAVLAQGRRFFELQAAEKMKVLSHNSVRVLREDAQRSGRPAVAVDTAQRLNIR